MEFGFYHRLEQIICLNPGNVNTELLQKSSLLLRVDL